MVFLYNIAIRLYFFLVHLAAFFIPKARLFVKGRVHTFEHINVIAPNMHNCIWFHVSSLGEFEQARPLIEEIKKQYPEEKIVLTFFSPSGYEIRKDYKLVDYVSYIPMDTDKNARQFIEKLKPRMAIFIKYDFWYHFLHQLKKHEIPTFLVSSIFRPNQVFFKWYGGFFRKMLGFFTHIFVQNTESKELLFNLAIYNTTVINDTRFDRVHDIAQKVKPLDLINTFKSENDLLIAGSTWPQDEKILITYINKNIPELKTIIAPHEIGEEHIKNIEKQLKIPFIRYSKANINQIKDFKVLIIDNIGMLSSLYQYGDIAYIGGGFGAGIHNILEPATFGMPILFGPKYKKFNEALELVWLGGAFPVHSEQGLHESIDNFLQNRHKLDTAKNISRYYVEKNIGGTQKVIDFICEQMKLKLY